jgi:redox-sensitive bicupin YhaK (pirin superfamily)
MSWVPAADPACKSSASTPLIETIIEVRARDLGGLTVRRVLPSTARQLVGPFIFLDHMGPVTLSPERSMDILPHPHINLATVTYLFEGEIVHRDSLGSQQTIRPGEINWMTAGRGIVHSERVALAYRQRRGQIHGIQLWVALPVAHEETEPSFHHHPAHTIPAIDDGGTRIRVLAGAAYGVESPVRTFSPLFYVDVEMSLGCELPLPDAYPERAAYLVDGVVRCGPERVEAPRMLVFAPGHEVVLRAESSARLVLLGGAPIDGRRHMWWNFISSRKERIEQAKRDWKEGRFPKVPGDEDEFIPLPG